MASAVADQSSTATVQNTAVHERAAVATSTSSAQATIDASTIAGGIRQRYYIRLKHNCIT